MKTMNRIAMGIALAVFATGCAQPTNPRQMPKANTFGTAKAKTMVQKTEILVPKADILFVIDDSESMATHQETLKANIDRFVSGFGQNHQLDFQIGVVSVFDSKRYGSVVTEFYPKGKLRPLLDASRNPLKGASFVTRAEGFVEVLGETLKIGVTPRFKKDEKGNILRDAKRNKIDGGGPEYEEIFSPMLAAVDGRNPGFIRPDAHLAVIIITDAEDSTPEMDPSDAYTELLKAKGGNSEMVSTYGILALKGCEADPGIKDAGQVEPIKIIDFLTEAGGAGFSLCDKDYGTKLESVGQQIQEKAGKDLVISLPSKPDWCAAVDATEVQLKAQPCIPLTVFFKNAKGEEEVLEGWKYDSGNNAIFIRAEILEKIDSGAVRYEYTAINGKLIGTKYVVPYYN
ncbi:MAG TPA: hypothetical protein VM432_06450 [Bdellovibrionales bacterium]|nr:hypothetical protein [Bdellovibrionales bacterium]